MTSARLPGVLCRAARGRLQNPDGGRRPGAGPGASTLEAPQGGPDNDDSSRSHHRAREGQKSASAQFFAEIFGLAVKPGDGYFAQVQVNESLTFDFADEPEPWGGPGFDPRIGQSHHYAFHVSDAEFDSVLSRVKARGIPYGSGPHHHTDGQIYTRRGGRGFYFEDPYDHLLEVMTMPETGS
jgi:catechol 2,3-dioxygenase-like lactoylglutathione lyase family enzyme